LIGGFAGAAVIKAGFGSLVPAGLIKIGVFMVMAPLIGMTVGFVLMVITINIFKNATPGRVDKVFRRGQLLSAAAYSLRHGTNDPIPGSSLGVGATQRLSAVRWGVAGRIITAWIVTIPASAAVAALTWWVLRLLQS